MFTSPALGYDSPYEVVVDKAMDDGLAVRCVESTSTYGTEVLARPTLAQIDQHHHASVREMCAWLVANNTVEQRQRCAVLEVRRLTSLDYTTADLVNDLDWIRQTDIGPRLRMLAGYLDDDRRLGILRTAAAVASASGVGKTDAHFIENLGAGLGFDEDTVMRVVLAAVQSSQTAA